MLTILFDIFPATGHYNATLKLARLLKQRGHRVVYIGPAEFAEKIDSLGVEFHIVDPHILPTDVAHHGWLVFFMECFINSFTNVKYNAAVTRIIQYDDLIIKYSPDLIVLDDHYIYKAIFYHRYEIKIVGVQSMIAKERDRRIPPFQSTMIPKTNLAYEFFIDGLWFSHILYKRMTILFNRIVGFGQDNFSLMKRFASENEFCFAKNITYQLAFGVGFKNIPMLKLSPGEFDFPRQPIQNHFYVGPLVDQHRGNNFTDLRYRAVIEKLVKLKSAEIDASIIYCSLGTVTDGELKFCDAFFKRIVEVAHANPHYKIILSVGKNYNIDRLLLKPDNLFVFQQVPQIDLLSSCDLMINHGGINSISECIFAGVPMLSYPLSPHWDQNGCAARIVFHRLGLRGRIKTDDAADISGKIDFVFQNLERFKASVLAMRAKFLAANCSHNAVSVIEYLAGSPAADPL